MLKLKFPKDYGKEELKGKPVEFKVIVNSVNETKLPDIDKDFIEKLGIKKGNAEALRIEIKKNMVRVTREVDGGLQTIDAKIPAVVSVDLRLNEPRYASLPNIMKAKRKPLEEISPADLGVEITQRLKIIKTKEPDSREAGLILENIDQLVEKIQENVGG